jgi:hypothetical protein
VTRVLALHPVAEREPRRQRQAAADDGVAAVEVRLRVEEVHRAAAPAGAAGRLSVHLGECRLHAHAARERMAVLAVGRDDPVALRERRHHADGDRLLAVVEVKKSADLLLRVELGAFRLEAADAQHAAQELGDVPVVEPRLRRCRHRSSVSSVERSPSGSPSSRAFRSRRMILPERVFGRVWRKAISRGATAGPRRLRA